MLNILVEILLLYSNSIDFRCEVPPPLSVYSKRSILSQTRVVKIPGRKSVGNGTSSPDGMTTSASTVLYQFVAILIRDTVAEAIQGVYQFNVPS